jgi:hypothetical protein
MTRGTRIVVAAALACWTITAAGLQAQDASTAPGGPDSGGGSPALSEADIFQSGAFDQAVEQSKQAEQQNKLEYLFGGVFLFSSTLETTTAFEGYTALGGFSGKAFLRITVPSYGSLYLGYNFNYTLFQGEAGSVAFTVPGEDLFANTFALSEFYLSFDLAKVVFIRIGNQLIAWGPSVIWTPVDFINRERLEPLATFDLRVGKPGIRFHLPMKSSNLFLFTDFSDTVVENPSPPPAYLAENLFEKTNFGLRWDFTALGFEFGLSGYLGADIQDRLGFDLSGRVLATDVYGEVALALPSSSDDFSSASALGFQRTLGELKKWNLQGEFFYNSTGQKNNSDYDTPAEFTTGGYVPFYVGQMYAYAGISKQDLIGTFLDGTLSGFINISDLSYTVNLKGSFDLPKMVPFSLSLGYSGGGEGKEFTVFSGDNALSLAARVSFEY